MKVLLDYNPDTNQISDKHGAFILTWSGLEDHEHTCESDRGPVPVETLVQLREAGYTTEDVVQLRKKGLL